MTRYAVLLRGINVGKAKRVGMADLRELLTAEGFDGVATVLQSGNVVLDASMAAPELARTIERSLERRFGFAVDVVVRTEQELRRVLAKDPFGDVADDESRYLVTFLAGPVHPAVADAVGRADFGRERCLVDGAETYAWCPDGIRDSPMLAALSRTEGPRPVGTMRNWRTLRRIVAVL